MANEYIQPRFKLWLGSDPLKCELVREREAESERTKLACHMAAQHFHAILPLRDPHPLLVQKQKKKYTKMYMPHHRSQLLNVIRKMRWNIYVILHSHTFLKTTTKQSGIFKHVRSH